MKLLAFFICIVIGFFAIMFSAIVGIAKIFKPIGTFVLFTSILLLTSCHGDTETYDRNDFDIIEIDGCQYIKINSAYGGWMAHKGNCNNQIHIYNSK